MTQEPENLPEGIDADFRERIDGFSAELRPLLGKYEIGFAAVAELTPDGRIEAKPIFVSSRQVKNNEEDGKKEPEDTPLSE